MATIEVKNLSKSYEYYKKERGLLGSFKSFLFREKLYAEAVKEISFSINEGELVGFLGPNGAGKTTTLKMLSGILYPTAGEVKVLGFTPSKREKAYQNRALQEDVVPASGEDTQGVHSMGVGFREIYEMPDG